MCLSPSGGGGGGGEEGRAAADEIQKDAAVANGIDASQPTPMAFARRAVGSLFDVVLVVWSVLINAFGALIGLGLLLNLSGYGYRVSAPGQPLGVTVKPLDEMRDESAMRRFLARDFDGLFPADAAPGEQPAGS